MIKSENKKVLIYIVVAFLFSFLLRLIWVYQFSDFEAFKFAGQFMLNTNDGYYWAEGARDFLLGVQGSERSPIYSSPAILPALISKLLSIDLDTVLFYLPAVFSSLIVVPLILIGKLFQKLEAGFIAALLASIAWSYYNRTLVGYYDTDFLNILLPCILLWSLMWAVKTSEEKYYLIAAIDTIVYRLWYPQSYSLEIAFIVLLAFYVVYLKLKKEDISSSIILITFLLFAMMNLDSLVRLFVVFLLFGLLKLKKEFLSKNIYYILALGVLVFLLTGGLNPVISELNGYVFRDEVAQHEGLGLHFYSVMQTVKEAGLIPFETFANRVSGSVFALLISMVGYGIFVYRYPLFLLSLPMLGLGFLAFSGGLRFTIYAVPIMALGAGYFIVVFSNFIAKYFSKRAIFVKLALASALSIGVLYPNIKHIIEYKIPTVFTKDEVEVLDKLKKISSTEDYTISWWDYGYPIRYFSSTNTLIDGGKHKGSVNFPVSFILTSPQSVAAKMSRLDVAYTQKRIDEDKNKISLLAQSNIEQMILDNGFDNTKEFFLALDRGDIDLPKKEQDIYFYLPDRMLGIFPAVFLFSNLDLMSGKAYNKPFFYQSSNFIDHKEYVDLGKNIKLLKKDGVIKLGDKNVPINRFITTAYDSNGILQKHIQTLESSSNLNVIFMKNYNKFLVLDDRVLSSLFIQLYVLENYDSRYFEPVILNPYAKVYKLRI